MAGRRTCVLRSDPMRIPGSMLERHINATVGVSGNLCDSCCRLSIHAYLQDAVATSEAGGSLAPPLANLLEPTYYRRYHRLGDGVHSQRVLPARAAQSHRGVDGVFNRRARVCVWAGFDSAAVCRIVSGILREYRAHGAFAAQDGISKRHKDRRSRERLWRDVFSSYIPLWHCYAVDPVYKTSG